MFFGGEAALDACAPHAMMLFSLCRGCRSIALRIGIVIGAVVIAAVAAAAWTFRSSSTRLSALPAALERTVRGGLPAPPAQVIVVIEENKTYADVAGNRRDAPYLNELAARGALFTRSYGVAHPSQPNYLALFAGVTDTNGDRCPPVGFNTRAPNLATELAAAHRSFTGYAEGLPAVGSTVCWNGEYARKHVPSIDFSNVPAIWSQPFSALPPYGKLPTVAFVIPNLVHDMHSASMARGDAWLRRNIRPLVTWAMAHDSLVIVTWDESDRAIANHIPTIFVGPMVRPGRYGTPVTHYRVLRTIEDLYGLAHAGASAHVQPIRSIWRRR